MKGYVACSILVVVACFFSSHVVVDLLDMSVHFNSSYFP